MKTDTGGFVILTLVILLVVLLGFGALAIDMGMFLALLFLEGLPGNDVLARLIGVFGCGSAPVKNDQVTGPYSVPIRLVRVS